MRITVCIRRDFVITDATAFLAAARRAHSDLYPDCPVEDAAQWVTCAVGAMFTVLERDGAPGDALDQRLGARAADGLECGGAIAQVSFDDPYPLPAGTRCRKRS